MRGLPSIFWLWKQETVANKARDQSTTLVRVWSHTRNIELILAQDTKLADRTAKLEGPVKSTGWTKTASPKQGSNQVPASSHLEKEALVKARTDLSEAQRSRGIIESRLRTVLDEVQHLKLQSATARMQLNELRSDKAALALKFKDRDEELKGKAKLLENVHDETVSLTLQLNMAEDQAHKLREENEDLVQRWMARMGEEADAMNEASKFQ
ncbi:MAG: hypothetical protein Q9210_001959 [Variospora velana]